MVTLLMMLSAAHADGVCTRTPIDDASVDATGIVGLRVEGLDASVALSGASNDAVTLSGSACVAGAEVRLVRRGDVLVVQRRGPHADGLVIDLRVPASVPAVSVFDVVGDVVVRDLDSRVAVVASVGDVDAEGVASLRVANLTGDVRAVRVAGALATEGVTGTVSTDSVSADRVSPDRVSAE